LDEVETIHSDDSSYYSDIHEGQISSFTKCDDHEFSLSDLDIADIQEHEDVVEVESSDSVRGNPKQPIFSTPLKSSIDFVGFAIIGDNNREHAI